MTTDNNRIAAYPVGVVCLLALASIGSCKKQDIGVSDRAILMELAWGEVYGYDAVHKNLPHDELDQSGKPMSSWRFAVANPDGIFPPADKTSAWDAAGNRGARSAPYHVYCFDDLGGAVEDCETKVLAVIGRNTAFDKCQARCLEDLPNDLILLVLKQA